MRRAQQHLLVDEQRLRPRLGVEILHAVVEIGILQAVPARFIALVGVVGMLMIGGLGANQARAVGRLALGILGHDLEGITRLGHEDRHRAHRHDDAAAAHRDQQVGAAATAACFAASTEA